MSDTNPTLADVATYFDDVATIHTSTGHIDAVDKAFDYAATVRLADELLGRCVPLIQEATQFRSDCEGRNLVADIRRIRGGE